jgi:hypothetical protein
MKGSNMHRLSKKSLGSLIILTSLSLPAWADSTEPKHNCAKPENPGKMASETRMKGFQKEVNDFRDCVNKFAQEQRTLSETHMTAGNKAIEEFNTFVKTELTPKKEE